MRETPDMEALLRAGAIADRQDGAGGSLCRGCLVPGMRPRAAAAPIRQCEPRLSFPEQPTQLGQAFLEIEVSFSGPKPVNTIAGQEDAEGRVYLTGLR